MLASTPLVLLVILSLIGFASAQTCNLANNNLLTNYDFEVPTCGAGGVCCHGTGCAGSHTNSEITGWTIYNPKDVSGATCTACTNPSIDTFGTNNAHASNTGSQAISLSGDGPGGIRQSFTTPPSRIGTGTTTCVFNWFDSKSSSGCANGSPYNFFLALTSSPTSPIASTKKSFTDANIPLSPSYTSRTFSFDLTPNTNYDINFVSTPTSGNPSCGAYIDTVCIDCITYNTPEPCQGNISVSLTNDSSDPLISGGILPVNINAVFQPLFVDVNTTTYPLVVCRVQYNPSQLRYTSSDGCVRNGPGVIACDFSGIISTKYLQAEAEILFTILGGVGGTGNISASCESRCEPTAKSNDSVLNFVVSEAARSTTSSGRCGDAGSDFQILAGDGKSQLAISNDGDLYACPSGGNLQNICDALSYLRAT